MATSLLTRFLGIFFIISAMVSSAKANEEAARPKQFNLNLFVYTAFNMDKQDARAVDQLLESYISRGSRSVCVCEIMELSNNNNQVNNVALFAEKTANGSLSNEYKTAERVLSKERRLMKSMFFDRVKTNTRMAVNSNCLSLFLKLKNQTPGLKLYDVINADVK